jgi:CRISPR-associated protein Cas1
MISVDQQLPERRWRRSLHNNTGGISMSFFSPTGRFLAMPAGRVNGNVLLRKKQYRISDSEEKSAEIARFFIFGKIYNSKWLLERTL